jgi:hypothetical protein
VTVRAFSPAHQTRLAEVAVLTTGSPDWVQVYFT